MTERAAIETLIKDTYAARCRGDLEGLMSHIHPDGSYRLIGAEQTTELCMETCGRDAMRKQMADLIGAFVFTEVEPLSLVVDGERAAYHWRSKVTFTPNGRSEVVEILDLVTTADGKIKTVEEFTDTTSILRLTAA